MGKRLVTIATFDQVAQAELAKNALEDEGIRATLTDASIVGMDWLLSNAVGGAKVQVLEEDAEKAVAVLENQFGEHGEGFGAAVSPEELAAQAEAAAGEDQDEADHTPTPDGVSVEEGGSAPVAAVGSRDDYARRMAFTAMLSGFPPVAFYALYLFMNAVFGEGELSPRGRYNLFIGCLLVTPALLGWWLFLMLL